MSSHISAIYKLLPRGRIWPDVPGEAPTLGALLDALAQEWDRIQAEGDAIIADFFPDQSVYLLAGWERILDLSSSGLTVAQRQAAVLAKLRGPGDPSYTRLAAQVLSTWGATLRHRLWSPPTADAAAVGDLLYDERWARSWCAEYGRLLNADPDAYGYILSGGLGELLGTSEGWTGGTARCFSLPAGETLRIDIPSSDDARIRFGCRAHTIDYSTPANESPSASVDFAVWDRSTAQLSTETLVLGGEWTHVTADFDAGTGGADAFVLFVAVDDVELVVSWAVAHEVDDVTEAQVPTLTFPLATYGFFAPLEDNGDLP